jgi:hypothetical protein
MSVPREPSARDKNACCIRWISAYNAKKFLQFRSANRLLLVFALNGELLPTCGDISHGNYVNPAISRETSDARSIAAFLEDSRGQMLELARGETRNCFTPR